jgi:aryl-alcohol dehydrogenase-like predicted oxidoreductase
MLRRMLPQLPFGRTGHASSRLIFGAVALGRVTQAEANATLDSLLEYGVNHIDTAASYGESEARLGPWLEQHRREFFLATKTGERTYQKAKEQLHRSLELLRTDRLDLIQMHCLIDDADWSTAMGPGGALEALLEAREQGLVRFIGVTGHELRVPRMHQRSLDRFDFDSVLLPLNFSLFQNPEYAGEFQALAQRCAARNIALQTIKSLSRGPKVEDHPFHTWYATLSEPAAIEQAVHWVLGHPRVFLNTAGDITLLPHVLAAAARFEAAPSDAVMQAHTAEHGVTPLFV